MVNDTKLYLMWGIDDQKHLFCLLGKRSNLNFQWLILSLIYKPTLFQMNYLGIGYSCSKTLWNVPDPVLQRKKKLLVGVFFSSMLSYDGSPDKYNNIYFFNLINTSLASKAWNLGMIMFGQDTSFCSYKESHFQILCEKIGLRKKPQN